MQKRLLLVAMGVFCLVAGYVSGSRHALVAHAGNAPIHGSVPRSYGRLVTALLDKIGTGLVFEDSAGVIRFVSMTGMEEGEIARR